MFDDDFDWGLPDGWEEALDEDEEEEAPFTFNKVKKRDPVRIAPPPNISELTRAAVEAIQKKRAEIRCPKCGALLVENKGSPRERKTRLVCHFCKNKQRRANAKAKREAKT